jgi:hypothetical protein
MAVATPELDQAMAAWEVVGMSLPDEGGPVLVNMDGRYGQEALLPQHFFAPARVELGGDNSSFLPQAIGAWIDNDHASSVLERHLGPHGKGAMTHIVAEYIVLAKQEHGATVAYTAGNVLLNGATRRSELILSVWDNGEESYASASQLAERFAKDGVWNLLGGAAVRSEGRQDLDAAMPTVATRYATEEFGGQLVLASDTHRVTASFNAGYDFLLSSGPPIPGNLMVAYLPHHERQSS